MWGIVVRTEAHRAGVADHGGGAGGVGAAVEVDRRPGVDEPPVAVGAVLVVHRGGVPVHVAEERLLAVVDHLHRLAGVQREQAAVHVHRQVLAAAERAADAGEVQPDPVGGQAEGRADLALVDVQPLRGDVEVDAAGAVRDREAGLGPEEGLVLHPDLVVARDDDVGGGVRVAGADLDVSHQVAVRVQPRAVRVAAPRRRRRPARGRRTRRRSASRPAARSPGGRRRRARPARPGSGPRRPPGPAGPGARGRSACRRARPRG